MNVTSMNLGDEKVTLFFFDCHCFFPPESESTILSCQSNHLTDFVNQSLKTTIDKWNVWICNTSVRFEVSCKWPRFNQQ